MLNSLTKFGYIVLTLLPELRNTNTDLFWKVIEQSIYKTYAKFVFRYLLCSLAPFLAIFTNVELVKTNICFLTLFFGTL